MLTSGFQPQIAGVGCGCATTLGVNVSTILEFIFLVNRISSGLIPITSELIRITYLVIRITSELIWMIFLVNRMSPELIPITSELIRISSEVIQISREVIPISSDVILSCGEVELNGGKQGGDSGAGYRNTAMGAPVGTASCDQAVVSGLATGLRVRLNSCFISFTNSSTPALGEATLAKAYTSSAC